MTASLSNVRQSGRIACNTNYSSSDYNGFRPNRGAPFSFEWNSPPSNARADYSRNTQQNLHNVAVDYDVFVNVPRLDR